MTINHKATAEKTLELLERGDTIAQGLFITARAQAHATIALVEQTAALVEQQRIANLIAIAEHHPGDTAAYWRHLIAIPLDGEQLDLIPAIRKGLGL